MTEPISFQQLAQIPIFQKLLAMQKYGRAIETLFVRALQGPIIGPLSSTELTPQLTPEQLRNLQNEINGLIALFQQTATTMEPLQIPGAANDSGIK